MIAYIHYNSYCEGIFAQNSTSCMYVQQMMSEVMMETCGNMCFNMHTSRVHKFICKLFYTIFTYHRISCHHLHACPYSEDDFLFIKKNLFFDRYRHKHDRTMMMIFVVGKLNESLLFPLLQKHSSHACTLWDDMNRKLDHNRIMFNEAFTTDW